MTRGGVVYGLMLAGGMAMGALWGFFSGGDALMAAINSLPPRQLQVLALAARGVSIKSTAWAMGLSRRSVEQHRKQARVALGVADLAAAAALYDANQREGRHG